MTRKHAIYKINLPSCGVKIYSNKYNSDKVMLQYGILLHTVLWYISTMIVRQDKVANARPRPGKRRR